MTTTLEANKALVRRTIEEGWNKADLAVMEELYAEDFVFFQEAGGSIRGLDSMKEWITVIHAAFPDIHYTIEDMYAEGDKVATRYRATGTHAGDFRVLGLPQPPQRMPGLDSGTGFRIAEEA